MTLPPLPPDARRSTVSARPGRLARWKLTEPARLYGYGVLAGLVLVLAAAGLITQELGHALTGLTAAVLGLVPATEAIRATVYSQAGLVAKLLEARGVDSAVLEASRREGLL